MASKQVFFQEIKEFIDFLVWANRFFFGKCVFRGVSNKDYPIEASTYRRLWKKEKPFGMSESKWEQCLINEKVERPKQLLKINEEIIKDARGQGHDQKDGQRLFDLDLLAELQHRGAATCLTDFTYNAMTALWFACQQSSAGYVNGKVVAVDLHDLKGINHEDAKKDISCFFNPNENDRYPLYHWQPKYQNNRIIAQRSIFIFGGDPIETKSEYIIPKKSKIHCLTSLERSLGITEASLFPDFDGFANQRAHNKIYTSPNVYGYIDLAEIALSEDNLDKAIDICTKALSLKPENNEQTFLYFIRTRAYKNKGEYDLALADCNKMITSCEKDPNFIINGYRLRGQIYEDKGDHSSAIQDYNKAIEQHPTDANVYYYRALLKKHLSHIDEATNDLQKALELANQKNNMWVSKKTEFIDKITQQLSNLE